MAWGSPAAHLYLLPYAMIPENTTTALLNKTHSNTNILLGHTLVSSYKSITTNVQHFMKNVIAKLHDYVWYTFIDGIDLN